MLSDDPMPADMPTRDSIKFHRRLIDFIELGNRFGGTQGERDARDAIFDAFSSCGLADVRLDRFPYLCYEPVAARCEVVGSRTTLPCTPLQSTAVGVAEGPAIFVGSGTEADLALLDENGVELAGSVAVMQGGFSFLAAPLLAERDIAGLVFIGESPEGTIGHFTANLYPPPPAAPWVGRVLGMPGVTVEMAAGRSLLMTMSSRPTTLRLTHEASYSERESANVCGDIPGHGSDAERIVIGAHYDSQLAGPGAWDNATGVAALLEVAEGWRKQQPRRTISLVAFALEEYALWGATHDVRGRVSANQPVRAMLNLDALGPVFPGTRMLMADPLMSAFAAESATRADWAPEQTLDASLYPVGDYAPYVDAGIPACGLWQISPQHPYYHTSRDVLEYVDVQRASDAAWASAYIAFRAAHIADLPFGSASDQADR